jgi:ocular albinism type 1 protein
MNEFNRDSYLIISMLSSTVGILGSFYQIFVRREDENDSRRSTGRKIIIYLAYSDMLASIGVFLRSGLWSFFSDIMPYSDDTKSVLFCAITSGWVQLFYTSTWLWTLIYAYNMRQSLLKHEINEKNYHILVWSISILFTAIGTTSLYYPDAE